MGCSVCADGKGFSQGYNLWALSLPVRRRSLGAGALGWGRNKWLRSGCSAHHCKVSHGLSDDRCGPWSWIMTLYQKSIICSGS